MQRPLAGVTCVMLFKIWPRIQHFSSLNNLRKGFSKMLGLYYVFLTRKLLPKSNFRIYTTELVNLGNSLWDIILTKRGLIKMVIFNIWELFLGHNDFQDQDLKNALQALRRNKKKMDFFRMKNVHQKLFQKIYE